MGVDARGLRLLQGWGVKVWLGLWQGSWWLAVSMTDPAATVMLTASLATSTSSATRCSIVVSADGG